MIEGHKIVSHDDWVAARKRLLAKEKEFNRLRDQLSQERRDLPWERVDKAYTFEGPGGKESLADLFAGKSQLVMYHFMFGPGWKNPCKSCSFWADQVERNVVHLAARDATLLVCSRAPLNEILPFKQRMGWTFKWVSSNGSDFNFDYHVSLRPDQVGTEVEYNYRPIKLNVEEQPGISVFCKDPQGTVFHTYSTYSRGLDMTNAAYHFLDLTPKGRDEAGLPHPMAWVRYRDSYGT